MNQMIHVTAIHVGGSVVSLLIGSIIFSRQIKGDQIHKYLGFAFASIMMIAVIVTFFMLSRGSYSFLHVLSAMSIYWICAGIYAIEYKPTNFMELHVISMGSAFLSLIIAGFGVLGRHSIARRYVNVHWLWYLAFGACVSIPIFMTYMDGIKKKLNDKNDKN